jgi:hypothetical protein
MFHPEEANGLKEKTYGVMRAALAIALLAIAVTASPTDEAQATQKAAAQPAKPTTQQLAEIARTQLLTHAKLSPKISNPNAESATAGIIAALRSQKQVADMELRELSAAAPAITKSPGPPASSTVTPSGPAVSPGKSGGKLGANTAIATNVPQPRSNTASSAVPQHPTGAEHPQMALPCRRPGIGAINGKTSGVVFTPDKEWNLYTIKGCGFGSAGGNIYLKGPFSGGRIPLHVVRDNDPQTWNDTAIVASLDPSVTGETDQDSVTLVIEPASGSPLERPGCKFFAVRETVQLHSIPGSAIRVDQPEPRAIRLAVHGPDHVTVPAVEQILDSVTESDPDMAAAVFRYEWVDPRSTDPYVLNSVYAPGTDTFDFSGLTPGFILWDAQIKHYYNQYYDKPPESNDWLLYASHDWHIVFSADFFRVIWGVTEFAVCEPYCDGSLKLETSLYAVNVWVRGPRGVNPWKTVIGIPLAPHKPNPAVKPHP